MVPMASAQLELVSGTPDWKLDRQTIEVGRAGIAKARAALESASERLEARQVTARPPQQAYGPIGVQTDAQTGSQTVVQLTIELPMAA